MPKGQQQKVIDRVGQRVGKLTVLSRAENIPEASRIGKLAMRAVWLCQCDCGNLINVSSHSLKHALEGNGGTRSCGCLFGKHMIKHGMVGTRIYGIWNSMRQRCTNPKNSAYRSYGGRGITCCKEWLDSFPAFFADMGLPPKGCSLDRKDNSLGYSKANCHWASRKQQGNNRRSNVFLTAHGKTQTLMQWADELGVTDQCIRSRLEVGWDLDRALSAPSQTPSRKKKDLSRNLN